MQIIKEENIVFSQNQYKKRKYICMFQKKVVILQANCKQYLFFSTKTEDERKERFTDGKDKTNSKL